MGLVDYSESESDSEPVAQPAPAPTPAPGATTASGKKPFQKIIDRSQPGKIRVSLPQTSSTSKAADGDGDENGPPAKRARVGGGGGAFSGFNSFLPPPKNTRKPVAATASSSSGKPAPRPGINLKTGAAPGFSREAVDENAHETGTSGGDDAEPPTKQPSIPAEQKPADEVKLVGKPLMFKPLSVSRKPGKKTAAKSASVSKAAAATATTTPCPAPAAQTSETAKTKREAEVAAAPPPPKKQKVSLFSIPTESADAAAAAEEEPTPSNGVYEPMFTNDDEPTDAFAAYDQQYSSSTNTTNTMTPNPTAHTSTSLSTIAADMNLSASARRELFGRGGVAPDAANHRLVTFDTTAEYDHNEALRTSGAAQQPAYNPLRGLAPGKHSLRQLVTQAQSHREALEDSFAQGKSHRSDAGARYGWR
ncbi:mitotic checkpoint regulator, MAD2B-interacting-domain-containing protein [Hypoxylon rubiginosum]|uniref:Mitotic checkpoint regulator, MAD2B-interacting-domain-containing protein n=1 Tax=Hypoxylon rubiginosum TaxID=110542 RepID=A0ACC0DEH2_9PEZI|nr:mitotic checkpoint regulator, MAD2B-interacting-domain-containing protein [Hypoxylon rubiginosum]